MAALGQAGLLLCAAIVAMGWAEARWGHLRGQVPRRGGGLGVASWLTWALPRASGPRLRVLQSARLSAQASVHLVSWGDKEWLIGCTVNSLNVLGSRPLEESRPAPGGAEPEPLVVSGPGARSDGGDV